MKKIISVLIVLTLIFSIAAPISAASKPAIKVTVNSKNISFILFKPYNGTTGIMVPLNEAAKGAGATVESITKTSQIKVTYNKNVLVFKSGSSSALVNGATIKMSQAAVSKLGRVYVPVRFLYEKMGGAVGFDSKTNTVVVKFPTQTSTTTPGETSLFTDVSKTHWSYKYITDLTSKGIITGYGDKFWPNNTIKCDEFVSMVLKAYSVAFNNGSGSKWYADLYTKASDMGLIDQTEPNDMVYIYPEDKINREQAARVIYNAIKNKEGYSVNADLKNYVDFLIKDMDRVNAFYKDGVYGTYESGILSTSSGSFRPQDYLTRAEACAMVYMLMHGNERSILNAGDKYTVYKVENYTWGDQGYPNPKYVYLDKKYEDYVRIMEIFKKENDNKDDGYFQYVYTNNPSNPNDLSLFGSLFTDLKIYQTDRVGAVGSQYFTITCYLNSNSNKFYKKYPIEFRNSRHQDYKKKINLITDLFKYLFGGSSNFALQKYEDTYKGKMPPEGTVYDTTFTVNGREVCISLYSDGTVFLRTTMLDFTKDAVKTPTVYCSAVDIDKVQPVSSVINVCVDAVNGLIKENRTDLVIVDVRTKEEYDKGHIKGAINIPVDTLEQNLSKIDKYKTKMVLVYCASGGRSATAVKILQKYNYTKILHFADGYNKYHV